MFYAQSTGENYRDRGAERERGERDRQTDRETQREIETERDRQSNVSFLKFVCPTAKKFNKKSTLRQ